MSSNQRVFYLDNLRVIAMIAVIFQHIPGSLVDPKLFVMNGDWWVGNIVISIVRFSVPIFLMITGALMLSKDYKLEDFLKKRLLRVIYPFVFWAIIYIIVFAHTAIKNHEISKSVIEILKFSYFHFIDQSYTHLWYLYMIIGIYLFIPVISKFIRNCSEKEIQYFLIIWIITLFYGQPIFYKYLPHITLVNFTGYLGYLVLGYYLSIKPVEKLRNARLISLTLIAIGAGITIFGEYFVCIHNGGVYSKEFNKFLTPNVCLLATGVFILLKGSGDGICRFNGVAKMTPVRNSLSKYSFGIYFVHLLILMILSKIGIDCNFITPCLGVPITAFICLFISWGIIYLINKMPFGKYISGV